MGRLIYQVPSSLDGYVNDADGSYDWTPPSEDLIAFLTDSLQDVSTYLYGRGAYQEMKIWGTDPDSLAQTPDRARFAEVWQAADKVVYSTSLKAVETPRTRLVDRFDPEAVRQMKLDAGGDLTIEGPGIAAHALREGLVEEMQRIITPVIVGGGTFLYPPGVRMDLDLVQERRFDNGCVFLRYRVR